MRGFYGSLVIFTLYAVTAAAAAPPPAPVLLMVRNETGKALECQVLAAHWYTLGGLTLAPGAAGSLQLYAAGGVVQSAAGLPVERIFCGFAGTAWLTRGEVDLRGIAGGMDGEVVCRAVGEGVECGG